jgi:hypothetical protein
MYDDMMRRVHLSQSYRVRLQACRLFSACPALRLVFSPRDRASVRLGELGRA